ncbi:MAG TPA: hypothetical protein VME63_10875 [Dyella sp.]|uniref:hypothetical protein n=1 Tax=Dyella sp. TaxID=1869338 RepID=UPI002CC525C3|nr:hypothetical protein [Dyella sp.]HTV85905.1 hypothetical protein [Dyella sp.]
MPYLIAQGGAVLWIVLALALLPTPWTQRGMLWPALGCYAVAFVSEKLDLDIFRWSGGIVSGHTVKHLLAAAAFYFILRMLQRQQPKTDQNR